MKKWKWAAAWFIACAASLLLSGRVEAAAQPDDTILEGVYAGEISLAGMTRDEATAAINAYVETLKESVITLNVIDDNTVTTTAGDLGLTWSNTDIVEEAVNLGKSGNLVVRYKALKDLEYQNKVYEIELSYDSSAIAAVVEESTAYNVEAVNAHLSRENGSFVIEEGSSGIVVETDDSEAAILTYLNSAWDGGDCTIDLVVTEEEPQGKAEDLALVGDVLGQYTTSYSSSSSDRSANVANGCTLINGTTLYPGESFSTYEVVSPFTEENGYYLAGSYYNGQVVDSIGGGICQVSTTLYNAVLLAELQVDERHNHSMIVTYVDPSMDAAIAESSGKDFVFTNDTDYPIYIEGYTSNKTITFIIYGVETRASNRKVSYESEVLETTYPDYESIVEDSSQPIGYVSVQSAHIGYKARLWKIVTVDGVETSKEQVNSSTYSVSPRTATVGTATSDANALSELQAAIATGSIDTVKSVAEALASGQSTTTTADDALSALLEGMTEEEQEAIIEQYNEQLAEQQEAAAE